MEVVFDTAQNHPGTLTVRHVLTVTCFEILLAKTEKKLEREKEEKGVLERGRN
jgi:hypothetical protein